MWRALAGACLFQAYCGGAAGGSTRGADVEHCRRAARQRASVNFARCAACHARRRAPLFPRMNASPYLFFSCPLEYSCARRGGGSASARASCATLRRCDNGAAGARLGLLHRDVHVAVQARQRACAEQQPSASARAANAQRNPKQTLHRCLWRRPQRLLPIEPSAGGGRCTLERRGAPRYSTPLLSLTMTGRPLMLRRKSAGVLVGGGAASAMVQPPAAPAARLEARYGMWLVVGRTWYARPLGCKRGTIIYRSSVRLSPSGCVRYSSRSRAPCPPPMRLRRRTSGWRRRLSVSARLLSSNESSAARRSATWSRR